MLTLELQSGPPSSMYPQEYMPDPSGNFLTLRHSTINNTIGVNTLPASSSVLRYDTSVLHHARRWSDLRPFLSRRRRLGTAHGMSTPSSCSARLPGMGDHGGKSTPVISGNLRTGIGDEQSQRYTTLIINPRRCLHGMTNYWWCFASVSEHASSRSRFLVVVCLHLH